MIFPAILVTDAKHPAISTNHLPDIDKTKHDYIQEQHKSLIKLTYGSRMPVMPLSQETDLAFPTDRQAT